MSVKNSLNIVNPPLLISLLEDKLCPVHKTLALLFASDLHIYLHHYSIIPKIHYQKYRSKYERQTF